MGGKSKETTSGVVLPMSKMIAETKTYLFEDYKNLGNAFNQVEKTPLLRNAPRQEQSHDKSAMFFYTVWSIKNWNPAKYY